MQVPLQMIIHLTKLLQSLLITATRKITMLFNKKLFLTTLLLLSFILTTNIFCALMFWVNFPQYKMNWLHDFEFIKIIDKYNFQELELFFLFWKINFKMKILRAAALFSLVAAECSWNEHNKERSKEKQISAYIVNFFLWIVFIIKINFASYKSKY